jgi:hypothetical protein
MLVNGCRTCASASALNLEAQPAHEDKDVNRISSFLVIYFPYKDFNAIKNVIKQKKGIRK